MELFQNVFSWIKKNSRFLISLADQSEKDIKKGQRFTGVVRALLVLLLFIIMSSLVMWLIWVIFSTLGLFMKIIAGILILFILLLIGIIIYIFVSVLKTKKRKPQ
ncbi:hypothetical protein HZC30_07740 [Candidatus Woesearchaeota archaeon]|nr:hypothetical protein [Candidatus Woesearchaeota archaeon]